MTEPLPATHPNRWAKPLLWIAVIVVLALGGYLYFGRTKTAKVTYTTGTVTKGTLVVSVTASGTMNSDNRVAVSAGVTGTVSKIYVKNGDTVRAGQTLMYVTMDQTSQLAAQKAQSSYLTAQSNVTNAKQGLVNANNTVTTDATTVNNAQIEYDNAVSTNAPATVIATKLTALTNAKNQLAAAKTQVTVATQNVSIANLNLTSARLSYNQSLGTITAPVAGTVQNITITPGTLLSSSSSSGSNASASGSGSNASSGTQVATIVTATLPTATFNLAEVDVPNVQTGQKATLTFDALSGKTYTGTVIGVNQSGTVSSGVTTYPMTIQLDSANPEILPNMTGTASIITKTDDNVLLVPSAAVKTNSTSGTSTVQVMVNGQPQTTTVEVGDANSTETVITSGLTEGQTVVTATITATTTNSSTSSSSLFGGSLRLGGGGGGFSGGTRTGGAAVVAP